MTTKPLHIKNAYVWDGREMKQRDLYTSADGRIADKPAHGSTVVDLDGYSVFPGLINAHDHLELNHYPRTKFREVYNNAHEWGEDMNARLNDEPFKSLRAYPLEDRLLIGGLKNLLCGATTVVHHGPPHRPMFKRDFPVRVLKRYGWAHSLHFDTDEAVVRSYRSTPPDVPWFIHLAEGTDDVAAREYRRLKALGCVGQNTVIVHGVGIREDDIQEIRNLRVGFVLCPSTHLYLLGRTLPPYSNIIKYWDAMLGSDSRLTAEGDLLDEMHIYSELFGSLSIAAQEWEKGEIANFTRSRFGKILSAESPADFILVRTEYEPVGTHPLKDARRAGLALVVRDGKPQLGDAEVMAKFPHIETVPALLDGVPKAIHIDLAQRIWKCTLKESGLEIEEPPKRKYMIFNR